MSRSIIKKYLFEEAGYNEYNSIIKYLGGEK